MTLGMIRLLEVGFDGTRVKANNGPYATRTAKTLEEKLGALAGDCLSPKSKHGRTITRDEYQEVRERTATRMASDEGRKVYNQRPRIAETTFGFMKTVMGIRQFLLRGLEKVKAEWLWACTAFNLGKLARELGRMRAEFSKLAAETAG